MPSRPSWPIQRTTKCWQASLSGPGQRPPDRAMPLPPLRSRPKGGPSSRRLWSRRASTPGDLGQRCTSSERRRRQRITGARHEQPYSQRTITRAAATRSRPAVAGRCISRDYCVSTVLQRPWLLGSLHRPPLPPPSTTTMPPGRQALQRPCSSERWEAPLQRHPRWLLSTIGEAVW